MKHIICIIAMFVFMIGCTFLIFAQSEELQSKSMEAGAPICIGSWLGLTDSVGGVDWHITYKNLSDKTIKYVYFEAVPYNEVGDIVSCEIRGDSHFRGRDTGPVDPGETAGGTFENAWYNSTLWEVKIVSLEVIFMDESKWVNSNQELIRSITINALW